MLTLDRVLLIIAEHGHETRSFNGRAFAGIDVLNTDTREITTEWEEIARLSDNRGFSMRSLREVLGY